MYLYLCILVGVDNDTIKRQTWSVVLTVFAAVLAIKKCFGVSSRSCDDRLFVAGHPTSSNFVRCVFLVN